MVETDGSIQLRIWVGDMPISKKNPNTHWFTVLTGKEGSANEVAAGGLGCLQSMDAFPVVRVVRDPIQSPPCLAALASAEGGEIWLGKFTPPASCSSGSAWSRITSEFSKAAKLRTPYSRFVCNSNRCNREFPSHRAAGAQTLVDILKERFLSSALTGTATVSGLEFGAVCGGGE